jgi:peptidyl-prolyl cis-trans isomerase D
MSILEKIRSRTGLLVGLVGLALAIFILESLLGSGQNLFGSDNTTVGTINGKKIDFMEYNNRINERIALIMQSNPQANIDDNLRSQIGEYVWNQLITDRVIKPEYKKTGIAVSEEELYQLMLVNPHSIIIQKLTDPNTGRIYEAFSRPDGSLDITKLNQWVNRQNPDEERFWIGLEKDISDMRQAEKYIGMIKKGLYVTTAEAKAAYKAQNAQMNVAYVVKRYNAVGDSAVKLTEDDIQSYYKNHQYEFKNAETSRKIEYVSYDVVPSEEDLANLEKDMQRIADEFKAKPIKEDSSYIAQESEGGQVTISNLTKKTMVIRDSSVYTDAPGTVYGPYNEGAYLKVYKLEAVKSIADSARVRHILIGLNDPRTKQERPAPVAKRMADSLLTLIKEKKVTFDTLVKTVSEDPGSIEKGGDYGWWDENAGWVQPFKDAGLEGTKGEIKVVETQFGYHIIEVLDLAPTRHTVYTVAQIFKLIAPSAETTKEYFKKANEFAGQNNTGEAFEKAVETQKLNKRLAEVKEADRSLPGLENTKELAKWVYSANKGDVSQVLEFKDKFIVAHLVGIREKGILPLEEVKDEVTQKARREKKANMFIEEFNTKTAGAKTIDDVATKMNLMADKQENLNFAAFNVMGLGREDALIGTAAGIKAGTLSKPVMGDNGVFVVAVNSIDEGTAPADYKNQQKQSEQMLGGRVDYELFNALKEKANIEEHRSRFE